MKLACCCALGVALVLCPGWHAVAQAAEPAAPLTIWKFLGIPQGLNKLRDTMINQRGNLPKLERKPPLKRIGDPANLESDNLAIQTAAKIKAEEDAAEQKIKAIKYLGTVGCGCYPGVQEALLAALKECNEDVKYEAAVAFCELAGDPASPCQKGCCSAEVMTKLREMAFGRDEQGCYLEPSSQVRAAAANALRACERKHPPAALEPIPEDLEVPAETPVPAPRPTEVPIEAPPANGGPPFIEEPGPEQKKDRDASGGQDAASGGISPVSLRRTWQPGQAEAARAPVTADARRRSAVCPTGGCCPQGRGTCVLPCEPGRPPDLGAAAPGEVAPGELAPGELAPGEARPGEEGLGAEYTPSAGLLASSFGAASGPMSIAPNMIGDFFGGVGARSMIVRSFSFTDLDAQWLAGGVFYTVVPDGGPVVAENINGSPPGPYTVVDFNDASGRLGGMPLGAVPDGGTLLGGTTVERSLPTEQVVYDSQFDVAYVVDVPSPGTGGAVGRTKIAENTSPIPRDRLLFDYSYFDSVPLVAGGVGVNRLTPGFEKTFCRGRMSFEMKIPTAVTLDSHILQDGGTDLSHGEMGNLTMTFKSLLLVRRTWAVSGGMTVTAPTADDLNLCLADGTPLLRIENEAVHLMPFVGGLWTPNDRFFAHGFLQWDVGANGNPVLINQGNGLLPVGYLTDTTFQYLDLGAGWWLYRGSGRPRRLTGLACTAELHWNQSLQDGDAVSAGRFRAGDFSGAVEVFNLTVGAHVELFNKTTLTAAYAMPLGGGLDRQFDGEFRLLVNRRFGPQTRLVRTPPTW